MAACENCIDELKSLDLEIDKLKSKSKSARDQYITLLAENLKKDHTINELNHQIGVKNVPLKFQTFEPVLGSESVIKLEGIASDKSKDSTFILTGLRSLYAGDSSFTNLSLSGRNEKEKIPPDKLEIIGMLFKTRLLGLEDSNERFQMLNKYIKNAIFNGKKKLNKMM